MNIRAAAYAALAVSFARKLYEKISPTPGKPSRALDLIQPGDYVLCIGFIRMAVPTVTYFYPVDIFGSKYPYAHTEILNEVIDALYDAGYETGTKSPRWGNVAFVGPSIVRYHPSLDGTVTRDIPGVPKEVIRRMEQVVHEANY